ncbi:DUF7064 domain-containing protein [Mycolicibacterium sp. XJ1819]
MSLDISADFQAAPTEDHVNHPPTESVWFQESSLFTICDPGSGVLGYYRIGIHPNLGQANAYLFTSAEPLDLLDRSFVAGRSIPDAPVNDCQVDRLQFEVIEPMRRYRIRATHPTYQLAVEWTPFFWPISVHSAVGTVGFARGHYNSIGRAVGSVESDRGVVEIDAFGYMDHSWGERKNHFPASKWIFACADQNNFVQAFPVLAADGQTRNIIGYAARDGRLRKLDNEYSTGYSIRDDWLTPSACDAELRDEDGRVFRLTGRTQGPEGIYPFLHGKFCVHALAGFTLDGRPAKGLLENSPPRAMPTHIVDHYGIDPSGMWFTAPDAVGLAQR